MCLVGISVIIEDSGTVVISIRRRNAVNVFSERSLLKIPLTGAVVCVCLLEGAQEEGGLGVYHYTEWVRTKGLHQTHIYIQ